AEVVLIGANGERRETQTDDSGAFRFTGVAPGRYEVRVTFEGFQPTSARLAVGARAPSPLRLTLPLAIVTQEITVSDRPVDVSTAPTPNPNPVSLDPT